MPNIPVSKPLAAPPLRAGLIDPRAAGAPFAAVSEGLNKIGDELFQIQAQQIADARQVEYAQGQSDIMGVFYEERLKAEEDPDIDGMPERFSKATFEGVQGVLAEIKDQKVHSLLSAKAETIANQQMFAIGKRQIERRADKSISLLPEQTRTLLDSYRIAESDEERTEIDLQASNLWRGEPHLTAVQQEAGFLRYKRTRDAEGATALLDSAPHILMGMSDEQIAELYPTFDPIERNSLAAKAKLKIGAEAISDIEIGIGRASSNHELDALEGQTESLFKSDLISPPKRTGVIKAIDRQRAAIAQDVNLIGIYEAGISGIPLDPEDPTVKKAIDAGFMREMEFATNPEEVRAIEANIIESTHIVPQITTSRLRSIGNSNNADAIATEAQSWEEYKNLAPQIIDQLKSERARVMFDNVAQDTRAGLSAAESVERTRDVLTIDKATADLRKTAYDAAQREPQTDQEWLQDNLGDFGFWRGTAEVPDTIAGPFSANVERHFMLDPNIENARKRATEDLNRVVGQSRVGAKRSVMPYPPEKVYPQFGGDEDVINDQLQRDVARLGNDFPESIKAVAGEGNLIDRIVIMSDPQTSRERSNITTIEPETGDEVVITDQWTPGYQIHWIDPDDETQLIPFINPDTGEAHRFYPQFLETELGEAYRAEIKERQRVEAENREINARRALDRNIEIILSEDPIRGEMGLPGKIF